MKVYCNDDDIDVIEDILHIGDNAVAGPNRVYLQRLSILESNPETKDWRLFVELNARLSKYSKFSLVLWYGIKGKDGYIIYTWSILYMVRKKVKKPRSIKKDTCYL